jgi:enoyl-CoA hydratase/carnithine racemase
MTTTTLTAEAVVTEVKGHIGHIHLNRPEALNALNLDMIRSMTRVLDDWQDDGRVRAVVVTGEGAKAFCAGGDVRALADSAKGDKVLARTFFREEYQLNHLTHVYPKPYIALIDGVVMGGGCGISLHGAVRVAGPKLMMAMPETGIGLFPDVGGGHFLSRMPGATGIWAALTGARMNAADAVTLGLATHFAGDFAPILAELTAADLHDAAADVAAILARHTGHVGESLIAALQPKIDRHFGHATVEAIIDSLDADDDPWAAEQLGILAGKSPTSLKITLEQIRRAKTLDLAACLQMEYRMGWRVVEGHDFVEGVRALLIDKDKSPKWGPSTLQEVTDTYVAAHFAPLYAADELSF